MNDSFSELREILKTGDIPEDTSHVSEVCHQRLLDALQNSPKSGDIVSLVRHVLRREDEKQGGSSATTLLVTRKPPFPNRSIWEQASITVLREDQEHYLISARPWQPEWLDLADQYPPDTPLWNEKPRRNDEPVSGDPFLKLMELDTYRSIGQREAIRAVLTAPDNSTLIINLPTGAGKSLCAQLPALLNSRNNNGVSVVVVPTTALAIDQERALKPFVHHATAYYSDDSVEGKERREGIRDRIRAGTQRIIFTSPESLMDSLAPALYEAAHRGILRYFIIDEAHMVEQWGDNFRPAFQEIPGLRRDLLRLSSFTTLLLTATLTESCLDTLETLFDKDLKVISAVQLRPEPAYWFKRCESKEVRKQRLLEAVYHLPRPLIIYGTQVKDVEDWKRELTRAGFKRCDRMTGKSTTEQREQLIEKWRSGKIDIVVATSAFGLGIDQADVRAVIHVCIPETIDRFYQEVGRGGRDGKACMSLTLYTTEDFGLAQDLNDNSAITIELGLQRWQTMFYKKETLGDGRFRVPVETPRSFQEKNIDQINNQNRAWNIRTLTLMNQANLIAIDSVEPPQKKNFESQPEEAYQAAWDLYRNSRIIRICNQLHLEKSTWESEVETVRQKRQTWSHKNLQLMKEALKPKRCISEIFTEGYSIPPRQTPETRNSVIVSRACGGCPVCRKNGITPFPGIMPTSRPVWQKPNFIQGKEIQRLFAGEKILLIFYDSLEQLNKFSRGRKLFKWLIEQGMKNIVVSPEYNHFLKESSKIHNSFIFLFDSYEPLLMPRIPTLIFHAPGIPIPLKYLSNYSTSTMTRIILVPINTPDPNREDRRLINVFSGRYFKFDVFCTEISI
ncbi:MULTISPECIES: protein DpdF [unclassified Nodularia (in: cyanobacteria)]|uniref:protein DpdF n=1 Tax=unclassified Nodularia (in: cyanobacteria) TaxID=2656917 RepID=UPI00187F5AB3|nr:MULTISPECIES: protein DpdF [unclassified Nodularia (in: cyanobacteria)]MBE9200076.1 ATP-dependent DNA helicase RecQ [Nodularia sp. LEGE 06071]MCC2691981.1 ATP-dependent DNA helicase RecQ [Nodularia sp. LEGE 04288]